MRILIVEDEPGISNFLRQGLEEESSGSGNHTSNDYNRHYKKIHKKQFER